MTPTVIDCVRRAAAQLESAGVVFGHGTTNAHDEAAWLVLWALGLPLDDLDGVALRPVDEADRTSIDALIARRIDSRVPAAYLTGEAWLQGVPFHVDPRAIVPRSLIAECLADGDLDDLLGREPDTVLDLCTGNGSLAALCAMAWPQARVDATDLSADALAVAERNVLRHGLSSRVNLLQGDGLAPVADRRYDLIVCNPPYVNAASMAELPPEFQAEPALALAGGPDGMDFIRPLMARAGSHLNEGGWLILEVGHERAGFERAFPRLPALWLATSAGEDLVLALSAADLQGLTAHPGRS